MVARWVGDTNYTDDHICPYCGTVDGGAWELQADDGRKDCGTCGNVYNYSRHVSVEWVTERIDPHVETWRGE